MPALATTELAVLATHTAATGGSDGGGLTTALFFIGLLGTPAWFIFSTLRWSVTVAIAVVAWALGIAYALIG